MYVVTRRFDRGSNIRLKDFNKRIDAEDFIQERLQEDFNFKINVNAIYGLYEGADILKEYTQADKLAKSQESSSSSDASSSQSAGSRSSFNPNPFNTAPRPAGMPNHWSKDTNDGQKKS